MIDAFIVNTHFEMAICQRFNAGTFKISPHMSHLNQRFDNLAFSTLHFPFTWILRDNTVRSEWISFF